MTSPRRIYIFTYRIIKCGHNEPMHLMNKRTCNKS